MTPQLGRVKQNSNQGHQFPELTTELDHYFRGSQGEQTTWKFTINNGLQVSSDIKVYPSSS